ncbi:uncharacterized protein LOC126965568 [Leptidea sinapis]|uniref:uncharacterized protein LOC126965568 n=1 Tax=Leptidea sinapis TaxID=189913 RepID=UPI0021C2E5F7|nr:uncharacterized protein LOC126965568 [Leptidea sinapis]
MATSKSQEQIFDRNLRRLEIKVKAYFTRMQDMYDSIAKLDTADKIDTFLSKASTIDIIRSDFVRTLDERNELLASEVNAGEPNYAAMLAFEDLYASVRFKYSQLSSRPNTHNTCETKMAFHKSSPKLPRLELMSFNGELENWPIFYETFKSSIHENIELNDSEKIQYLMEPSDIDLLVGSDFFARIIRPNIIARGMNEPVAIETLFGFIIYGQAPVLYPETDIHTYCTLDYNNSFEKSVGRFFELEDVPKANILSSEEQECENFYSETTARDHCGRYIVALPFKDDPSKLGNSLQAATRRYLSLERKLLSNVDIHSEYHRVFSEYLEKGYLAPITNNNSFNSHYVIPHHVVLRPDKSTTKLRVVLDASMKTSSGLSLNDMLHVGPNLQNDLFKIILNFRLFPIAINADIKQMFLRILVKNVDRPYQMVLYRENNNQPLRLFQVTRVPFGLCCSPYLAIRTVRQLITDEGSLFPAAAPVAERDIFMDDLATSCGTPREGIELSQQLVELFHAGGFDLVKFSSNSVEVMESIPSSARVSSDVEFSPDDSIKILGLRWLPSEDVFAFTVNIRECECTKRNILSTIARIWDLMGLVAPVTLLGKLIIQSLWSEHIDWDEKPPQKIVSLWRQIESELHVLETVKIPRFVGYDPQCVVSVLGFADASEKAYGAKAYLFSK